MTTRKEDIRITKTKAALSDAFFKMLAVMTLDDITVNELCERANVRRATFYKHFKDKNDFVVFLIKDIRSRFDNEVWKSDLNTTITKDYYLKYAKAIIDYLLERDAAIKRIIDSNARTSFFDLFLHENYEDTKRRLEASVNSGMTLAMSTEVMASFIVGGIAHAIIKWFDSDNRCPVDLLLQDISIFITKMLP